MSFITASTVANIAKTVDGVRLEEDAAKVLAPDVEYRLREVVQVKCCVGHPVYAADQRCTPQHGGGGLMPGARARQAGWAQVRQAQQAHQADSGRYQRSARHA